MLRRIVANWAEAGHRVDVLSAQPSYKPDVTVPKRPAEETMDGFRIRRLDLPSEQGRPLRRILNAIRLAAAILRSARSVRYDVIMVSTAPPVVPGVAAAIAARLSGARLIYHCMDIHPEAGRLSGEFSNGLVFAGLRRLDGWTCQRANPVVVLSADMEASLRRRPSGSEYTVTVLNNFALPTDDETPAAAPIPMAEDGLDVLFAGNLGRFQGLHTVVEAMALLVDRPDIRFIFMGEGPAKAGLQSEATRLGANITFLPHQTAASAKSVMRRVDCGYVGLAANVIRYAYPSKTMTYLEQGCPLIVSVEADSELARDTLSHGYGKWVPPEDAAALAALLRELADAPALLSTMRERAKAKFAQSFSERVLLGDWRDLLAADG